MKGGRKPAPTLGTVLSKLFFTLYPASFGAPNTFSDSAVY
jgi:hypothetical protein